MTSSTCPAHATPPTRGVAQRARSWALRLGVGLLCVGLTFGVGASTSTAESLNDRADEIRKALVETKKDISSAQDSVSDATTELQKSQALLAKAKRKLAAVSDQLASIFHVAGLGGCDGLRITVLV
ncbi:MAG: hypothetical protein IPL43_02685 [Micropruina sp.]|nr:hypothetical protein [Micropruina sp.]